jgi:hypothetical protein
MSGNNLGSRWSDDSSEAVNPENNSETAKPENSSETAKPGNSSETAKPENSPEAANPEDSVSRSGEVTSSDSRTDQNEPEWNAAFQTKIQKEENHALLIKMAESSQNRRGGSNSEFYQSFVDQS